MEFTVFKYCISYVWFVVEKFVKYLIWLQLWMEMGYVSKRQQPTKEHKKQP